MRSILLMPANMGQIACEPQAYEPLRSGSKLSDPANLPLQNSSGEDITDSVCYPNNMNKIIIALTSAIILTACSSKGTGPYAYPGYYQPAQYQNAYMSEGAMDGMGNYHPPVEKGGQYVAGRWYRAQPTNPGPIPQKVYAQENPWATQMGEVSKVGSNGDVATSTTCRYRSC